jgi:hypothetical protein
MRVFVLIQALVRNVRFGTHLADIEKLIDEYQLLTLPDIGSALSSISA